MQSLWIVFVFIYSILKGGRDGMKKAALKKSSTDEVLFFYTLIGFVFTLPNIAEAIRLPYELIFFIFIKSAVCCTAWLFSCMALGKMSVSLYGVIDLSRVLFSTMLGVFALGESMTWQKAVGASVVIAGLLMLNAKKTSEVKTASLGVITAALLNCFFNAVSGTMDKVLMKYMSSSQLQFWFMLFMTLIYLAVIAIKRERISVRTLRCNIWIPLMSISLVLGDRFLFEANAAPQSEVTVMTIIKQSSVVVSVLVGRIFFKEKQILYKLLCALVVLLGIFIPILIK